MGKTIIPSTPVATFNIENADIQIDQLEVEVRPIQSGNGDPSPENIRPITGRTECNIWDDPVYGGSIIWNQLRNNSITAVTNYEGLTTEYVGNKIKITNVSRTSNYTNGSTRNYLTEADCVYAGHKYIIFGESDKDVTGVGVYINQATTFYGINTIITAPVSGLFRLRINKTYDFTTVHPVGDVTEVTMNICDLTVMFGAGNEPATLAEFKELIKGSYYDYNAGTVTAVSAVNDDPYEHTLVSWETEAGTIYGGALNVTDGKLKSCRYYESYNGEPLVGEWISSMDKYEPNTTPTTGAQVVDLGDFVEEYTIEPQEIDTLIGINNLWSDAGNVALQYHDAIKKIKLNGKDVSEYFTPNGMKVLYKKVLGKNGGTYLSGDREEDVLAWKSTVKLICMPLNETQQADLLSKVTVDDPTLYYFDPRINACRTIHYMADLTETRHRGKGSDVVDYWTGLVLTAEEK